VKTEEVTKGKAMTSALQELTTTTCGLKVFPIGKRKRYGVAYKGYYYILHLLVG